MVLEKAKKKGEAVKKGTEILGQGEKSCGE